VALKTPVVEEMGEDIRPLTVLDILLLMVLHTLLLMMLDILFPIVLNIPVVEETAEEILLLMVLDIPVVEQTAGDILLLVEHIAVEISLELQLVLLLLVRALSHRQEEHLLELYSCSLLVDDHSSVSSLYSKRNRLSPEPQKTELRP
jgi:hypothetical protein